MNSFDLSLYHPGDPRFDKPYIDVDEHREAPVPHRHIHGGFEGTDTRFRFYFPAGDSGYQGRMFNPLTGASGGSEDIFGGPYGDVMGGLEMCFRLGGYMVESNQGHIGTSIDHRFGEDPGLYGWVATTEVARLSKYVAAQNYGEPPHHSYVFGGSGGARRSPLSLENAPDVWDGALPFMGSGDIAEPGNNNRVRGPQPIQWATQLNVQRLLGAKVEQVADAMAPGGSGDPYAGLPTHQREELASLYRQGFPRGLEHMIAEPLGQIWLWATIADMLAEEDPTYFENFWTKPGYVGHDNPEFVADDVIDAQLEVKRLLTLKDVMSDPAFQGPEYAPLQRMAMIALGTSEREGFTEIPIAVEVTGLSSGYRLGCGVRVVTGKAAGRQQYAIASVGDILFCDGYDEASLQRFTDVVPGDEVHLDNRKFLAYCYYARHHAMADMQFDSLRVDGKPIHCQHPIPVMSAVMGNSYSGKFAGKLIWVHHTHDSEVWPPSGVIYADAVRGAMGERGFAEQFRIRWSEHAEHIPTFMVGESLGRAANTWLIEYMPIIEQSLADLVDWVENGIEPAGTTYEYRDGRVTLPATATERRGIQPVVRATANGASVAEVAVGEAVALEVHAEVPPGAGTIVAVEWDFDGSGTFPVRHEEIDGTVTEITLRTTHRYERRGTYFPTALVHSHRDGDPNAEFRRIPNLAQVRVVVS
ncbi:MAG: hypothetical protein ACLP9Y_28430 [Mycobacterium sp.]